MAQELVAPNAVASYVPWATPRARLAYELDMFRQEYLAMLYGGVVRC